MPLSFLPNQRRLVGCRSKNNNDKNVSSFLSILLLQIMMLLALIISHTTTSTTVVEAFVVVRHQHQNNARRPVDLNRQYQGQNAKSSQITNVQRKKKRGSSSSSSSSSSRLHMDFMGMEEILYNAEATASRLASTGLQNPNNLFTSLPIMYGAGLLTSISPCVWGLLPLTMSYISTAAGERSDGKVLLPTLAFAMGLAAVFCSLGIAVAELGGVFGSTTSGAGSSITTFILPFLSYLICFIMGMKLLDLVDIPLPSFDFLNPNRSSASSPLPINNAGGGSVYNNNNDNAELILFDDETGALVGTSSSIQVQQNNQEGNSLVRTFLLGGSSALVASPCATPVLTSILGFVASSQNPVIGATLLFSYTLGYSTPLLIIASTGGQALADLKQQEQRKQQQQQQQDPHENNNGATLSSQSTSVSGDNLYGKIVGPWVTPLTAGILLWYGTNGVLTSLFGDPSLAGLTIIE